MRCSSSGRRRSAFAANQLGKNTVGSAQLKKNAVVAAKVKNGAITGGKLANGAVTNSKLGGGAVGASNLAANSVGAAAIAEGSVSNGKLANDSVNGSKVQDNSLTGSDIQQGTLNAVKAANVYSTEYDESATKLVRPSDPGIKSGGCFLICIVEFPVNIEQCSVSGNGVDATGTGSTEVGIAEIFHDGATKVGVSMWNAEGNLIGHDFSLTVVCPTA